MTILDINGRETGVGDFIIYTTANMYPPRIGYVIKVILPDATSYKTIAKFKLLGVSVDLETTRTTKEVMPNDHNWFYKISKEAARELIPSNHSIWASIP